MRKSPFSSALKLILSALFFPLFLSAQDLSLAETRPDSMTVCMGDYPFSLKITNNTGSTISSMQVMLRLPDYITYSGNLVNATAMNLDDPSEPVFGISQILPYDSLTISYTAEASCGIIGNINANLTVQNSYAFSYLLNGTPVNRPHSTFLSYNLLYASLSLVVNNSLNETLTVGERVNRNTPEGYRMINITNGGNGQIDTVLIRITPEPEISYNAFISAYDLQTSYPFYLDGNDIVIKLHGALLQSASNQSGSHAFFFDPGENIRLIEDFTIISCSAGNTSYQVQWGCNNEFCNDSSGVGNATTSADIHVATGNARFDLFTGSQSALLNYCGKDGLMEFSFVNTGSNSGDFAKDIRIDLLSYEEHEMYILPLSFELFDYRLNGQSLAHTFITGDNAIAWYSPKNNVITPGYRIDFTSNTDPALLPDLDGDGFYDDLAAGDTIRLSVRIRYIDQSEFQNECPLSIMHNYALPQISWKTSCGEPRNSIDGSTWHQNRYDSYNYPDKQSLTDAIDEPIDFIQGIAETFVFCTGTWYYDLTAFDCPVNEYRGVINLPDGYHLFDDSVSWFSSAGDTLSYLAIESANQVIIEGGGTSSLPGHEKKWTGCFSVQLVLDCPEQFAAVSPISWELQYKCDTCDVYQRRVCLSDVVYNHFNDCPNNPNNCQIASTGFEIERTSFGWTDATRSTHVTRETPGINLHAAYVYDEIQTISRGTVYHENMDAVYVEIHYTATDTLFEYLNGSFEVYRNGALYTTCAATNPSLEVKDKNYAYLFTMTCPEILEAGDSLVLKAHWRVAYTLMISKIREYEIPDFRSSYIGVIDDIVYSCESWGERFILLNTATFPLATLGAVPNGCNNLTVNLSWMNWGGTGYNDFPYEFRNVARLDSIIRFSVPAGYEYVPGSARMFAYTSNDLPVNPHFFLDAAIEITPGLNAAGDTLIFNEAWPLLDKNGQGQSTFGNPPTMSFEIMPTCEHNDTVRALMDFSYTHRDYLENETYRQELEWTSAWHDDGGYLPANMLWYHYLPNLTVNTGLSTVDAYESSVNWDIQVCNKPDAAHPVIGNADGVWADIDNLVSNTGNIYISSIEALGNNTIQVTAYDDGKSAFTEIGRIDANVCKSYRVHATYTGCRADELDTLRVLTGWNCGGYPAVEAAEAASCQVDTAYLQIRYKTANLQMAVFEPGISYNVCDTIPYEIQLTSSEPANMYELDLWTNLPAGAQIVNAYYRYPEDNAAWTALNGATSDYNGYNAFGWNLSQVVPQFANGFTGSRSPEENEIRVRFDIVLDCNYNPGQEFLIFADGVSNCADPVELNGHYSLPINGFGNLVNYKLSHKEMDTISCVTDNSFMSFTVTNLENQPNLLGDSLKINLPQGFTFVSGSAAPQEPVINGSFLTWPVGAIAANGSKTFSFRMESSSTYNPENGECTPLALAAEIFKTQNSGCSSGCDITASWYDTLQVVYCCALCPADAAFSWTPVCMGSETCFSLTMEEMNENGYAHEWNFGDGTFSSEAEPCHLFTSSGSHTVTHVVKDIRSGCADTVTAIVSSVELLASQVIYDDTICIRDTACFTSTAAGRDQWSIFSSNGNLIAGFGDIAEMCFQFSNTGNYTVEHILDNGCSTDTVISIITVIPPIEACIVMIGQNPFCEGDRVYLTVNDPYNQVNHIDWYRDGVYVGSMDTLTVTTGGTYAALVVDQNGCTNSCMCMTLSQKKNPKIKLTDKAYICGNGDTEVLFAAGFKSYIWYHEDILAGGGPSLTVDEPGTYFLEATSVNGCISSDSVEVEIRIIDALLKASALTACLTEEIELNTACDPDCSYQWQRFIAGEWADVEGSECSFETRPYKTGPNSFRVIINDELTACQSTQSVKIEGITRPCNDISVQPNPSRDHKTTLFYNTGGKRMKQGSVEIISMRGERVAVYSLDADGDKRDLDFSGYAEGVYLVRVIFDGEILATEKIVVVN